MGLRSPRADSPAPSIARNLSYSGDGSTYSLRGGACSTREIRVLEFLRLSLAFAGAGMMMRLEEEPLTSPPRAYIYINTSVYVEDNGLRRAVALELLKYV